MKNYFLIEGRRSLVKQLLSSIFFKYAVVGLVGTFVNLTVYSLMMVKMSFNVNLSSVAAFAVAVLNNYLLNHAWTFSKNMKNFKCSFAKFFQYLIGNSLGLLINLTVLNALIYFVGYKFNFFGQVVGILAAMTFNFLVASRLVFNRKYQ